MLTNLKFAPSTAALRASSVTLSLQTTGSGAFLVAGLGALNALHGFEGPLKTAGAAAAVHAFNLHELLHYKFPP